MPFPTSHCQNNFGNAFPRRSRWKRSLVHTVFIHNTFLLLQNYKFILMSQKQRKKISECMSIYAR